MGESAQPDGKPRSFGRIISKPDEHEGRPFLIFSGVEVEEVLTKLRAGQSDTQILSDYAGQKFYQADIDACRAWQARFEPGTLSKIFNRVSDQNVIMLDENMSYKLLYDVTRLFGRSSHVYADGLCNEHNDDESDIWAHMVANKYAAIITADNDFKRISHDYRQRMIQKYGSLENCPEHIPAVIFLPRAGSWENTRDLLEKHAHTIRKYIEKNDAICAEVSKNQGFQRITHVTHFKAPPRHHRSNDNTPPPDAPAP